MQPSDLRWSKSKCGGSSVNVNKGVIWMKLTREGVGFNVTKEGQKR